jgi:hypothetical protein
VCFFSFIIYDLIWLFVTSVELLCLVDALFCCL